MKLAKLAMAVGLVGGMMVGTVQAATVTPTYATDGSTYESWTLAYTYGNPNDPNSSSVTLTCVFGECDFLGATDDPSPSDAAELAYINQFADPDFVVNMTKVNGPASPFTITGEYFLAKFGNSVQAAWENL